MLFVISLKIKKINLITEEMNNCFDPGKRKKIASSHKSKNNNYTNNNKKRQKNLEKWLKKVLIKKKI